MAIDLLFVSFLGSALALLVGGLAIVVAAGWFLHSAARGRSALSPDEPLNPDQIKTLVGRFGGPDGLPGAWSRSDSSPGEPRTHALDAAKGVATPRSRARCSFCSWIRQRFSHR